jgi:hypothetical protein
MSLPTIRLLAASESIAALLSAGIVRPEHVDRSPLDYRQADDIDYLLFADIIVALSPHAPATVWARDDADGPAWDYLTLGIKHGSVEWGSGRLVLTAEPQSAPGAGGTPVYVALAVDRQGRPYRLLWDPARSPFVDDHEGVIPPADLYEACDWDYPTEIASLDASVQGTLDLERLTSA